MQAGKALEQLVGIIQEHLKDNPDVQITRNAKLVNRSGNKREIDVFVQTKVNGENIGIAFECKDYKRKVTEPTIDAFWAKINDLPQVHKGIIVTTTGYTPGAQKEAIEHKIGLYLIDEIPIDEIIPNYNFYGVRMLAEPIFKELKGHFIADEPNIIVEPNAKICYIDNDEEVNLVKAIFEAIFNIKTQCELAATYMRLNKKAFSTVLKISLNRQMYIKDIGGRKYKIDFFEIPIKVNFIMEQCHVASQKKYSSIRDENVVSVSEYCTSMSDCSWVVVESKDDKNSYYLKNNGCYYQPNYAISGKKKDS